MRIKLDENLPEDLSRLLSNLGHEVDTVAEEGLAGATDGSLWEASCAGKRLLVTQNLDFSDLRRFTPGTHPGLVLIRLRRPSRRRLIGFVHQLFHSEPVSDWSGYFVVATDSKIRVRRPIR